MTALLDYDRLETVGVWRASETEQRRDVTVSLGSATVVIYDGAGRALAHWSLPAMLRRNPGKEPAVYTPSEDAPEELEIADPEMIDAIERIRSAIDKRRPRQGRLRFALMAAALVAVLAAGLAWIPDALVRHAINVVPPVKRAELGARILDHVQRLSGSPCKTHAGVAALTRLHSRLFPGREGSLVVLSSGAINTGHLPGGVILLSRRLVEDHDTPDVAAGFILAEALRADQRDPIAAMLEQAGPTTAARLLTTGDVPDAVLARYAERFMTQAPISVDDEALLTAFREARVASTPYAFARDITGETTLALIEADPGAATAVLPDSAWLGLQEICAGDV